MLDAEIQIIPRKEGAGWRRPEGSRGLNRQRKWKIGSTHTLNSARENPYTSRQTLLNYAAKPEFVDTITRGKSRVEAYAAERLFDRDGAKGAEFTLACNFGWRMPKETAEEGEKAQSGVVLMPEVQDESHT